MKHTIKSTSTKVTITITATGEEVRRMEMFNEVVCYSPDTQEIYCAVMPRFSSNDFIIAEPIEFLIYNIHDEYSDFAEPKATEKLTRKVVLNK